MVELLLLNGADPNSKNEDGKTAVEIALRKGFPKTLVPLLAHGAQLPEEMDALICQLKHPEVLRVLAARGVNLNVRGEGGSTPLNQWFSMHSDRVDREVLERYR
jgi:ankyrin repeat protein